jgi:hypothetical protein
MCPNLNAQYLNGQSGAYYGRATNEVPAAMNAFFWSAGFIPAGTWARNTSADGRIIVGAGTTFSVTFNENAQSGGSWSHDHVGDDHTHTVTGTAHGFDGNVGQGHGRWLEPGPARAYAPVVRFGCDEPRDHGRVRLGLSGLLAGDGLQDLTQGEQHVELATRREYPRSGRLDWSATICRSRSMSTRPAR